MANGRDCDSVIPASVSKSSEVLGENSPLSQSGSKIPATPPNSPDNKDCIMDCAPTGSHCHFDDQLLSPSATTSTISMSDGRNELRSLFIREFHHLKSHSQDTDKLWRVSGEITGCLKVLWERNESFQDQMVSMWILWGDVVRHASTQIGIHPCNEYLPNFPLEHWLEYLGEDKTRKVKGYIRACNQKLARCGGRGNVEGIWMHLLRVLRIVVGLDDEEIDVWARDLIEFNRRMFS